jgi:hypothetical protein
LDEDAFPAFSELLAASQAYADFSGCRFHKDNFRGVLEFSPATLVTTAAEQDISDHLLVAKLRAAPVMLRFAKRLEHGDVTLAEELERASHIVTAESLHNSMCATFKELELWPPSPAPAGISDDDCAYLDLSAPMPVIAQRAYNEKVQRLYDVVGSIECKRRVAETASFLLDFSQEVSSVAPKASFEDQQRLARFTEAAAEYRAQRDGVQPSPMEAISEGLERFQRSGFEGFKKVSRSGQQWYDENRELANWTVLGALGAGVVGAAVGAAAASSRARRAGR